MDIVALTILALIIGGVVMSLLLSRYARKIWVWYIPSMIGVVVISYYSLFIELNNLEGHVELGYIFLIFMIAAVMLGNILANIFVVLRRRAK